jgi:predicted alpha/beta-fold hydrolase
LFLLFDCATLSRKQPAGVFFMVGLDFKPLSGLSSNHLQTILSVFFPPGLAPPSNRCFIDLGDGDKLSCHVSIPNDWTKSDRTVVLVHGMGGCHNSGYMIRMARKLYLRKMKVVRVNLRGAGSGEGLSKRPYHGGTSFDVLNVIHVLKKDAPESKIVLIGFSLGGNVILKLAGELGESARDIVRLFIAVCPPVDLLQTVRSIEEKRNRLYHNYYLKKIRRQASPWGDFKDIRCLSGFDDALTAPMWGFTSGADYYRSCSSFQFLPSIRQKAHILFAEDDPFVSGAALDEVPLPDAVRVWKVKQGGHMGFLGSSSKARGPHGLDPILLNWAAQDAALD